MKTYTFIIGTMDDFESLEALMAYAEANHDKGFQDYALFEFEAPKECDLSTVQLIGYGIAFDNDWAKDDTFSFFVEGTIDTDSERQAFEAGVEGRERLKESARSKAQDGDVWSRPSNDPVNW